MWSIAAAVCLAHLLTNSRYGFHHDELQFLSDALDFDWGYVSYPPLTPFVELSPARRKKVEARAAQLIAEEKG